MGSGHGAVGDFLHPHLLELGQGVDPQSTETEKWTHSDLQQVSCQTASCQRTAASLVTDSAQLPPWHLAAGPTGGWWLAPGS